MGPITWLVCPDSVPVPYTHVRPPGTPSLLYALSLQEAYSVARQFNLIPPVCEQAEYHLFQREKVEVQLPELYHKIGRAFRAGGPWCSLGLVKRTPLFRGMTGQAGTSMPNPCCFRRV